MGPRTLPFRRPCGTWTWWLPQNSYSGFVILWFHSHFMYFLLRTLLYFPLECNKCNVRTRFLIKLAWGVFGQKLLLHTMPYESDLRNKPNFWEMPENLIMTKVCKVGEKALSFISLCSAWTSLYMDGTASKIFLVICPHEAGTWDPNYAPGVDFLDHNFLSSKNSG